MNCDLGYDVGYVFDTGLGFLGIDAKAQATIEASRNAGRMVSSTGGGIYVPGTGDCADAQAQPGVDITTLASGLALTGLNVAAMSSPAILAAIGGSAVLGAATLGIGSIIGLFGALHAHHAAAVRREQTVLCSAVPAFNNYLDIIDKAVATGQAPPDQAVAALDSLNRDFHSELQSIYKDCNAACVMGMVADAVIGAQKQKYQALADQAAAQAAAEAAAAQAAAAAAVPEAAAPPRPNVTSISAPPPSASSYAGFYAGRAPAAIPDSGGIPVWMKMAAAAALGYFLLEAL